MIEGRRAYPNSTGQLWMTAGAYGKDGAGRWFARPPVDQAGLTGDLSGHSVEEHEDGTITVTPSILITMPDPNDPHRPIAMWHGYLERGIWREA